MAARTGQITTANITVAAREVDFVTRFGANWQALRDIMGIMRPIRKAPGTKLTAYKASAINGLKGGKTVAEGDEIPLTQFKVEPVAYGDIEIHKHGRSVTVEAVAKYGAAVAVSKTDEAFLNEIQSSILDSFYTFLKTGSLTGTETNFQRALSMAPGAVLKKFASMRKNVTEVVAFANITDAYDYLGDKDISVQSEFGLNYIKNFLGYRTVFLLPDEQLPVGKVIALPVENIDLYYIDPSDRELGELGLEYRVEGETNLIGVHVEPAYNRAAGDLWAIYGIKLWAEYLDGIAVYTISAAESTKA